MIRPLLLIEASLVNMRTFSRYDEVGDFVGSSEGCESKEQQRGLHGAPAVSVPT